MIFKTIIILTMVSLSLQAKCDDVVYLKKGDSAPTDGYLFSLAKTQDTKNKLSTLADLQAQVTSYQHSEDLHKANESLYQQQVDLLSKQNTTLVANQQSSLSMSTWERIGYFALGVLATSAAIYATEKIVANK